MAKSKPLPNIIKYKDKRLKRYKYGIRASLRLEELDNRTKVGRTAKMLTDYLWDFVGEFSPVALLLIDRIVFKSIQLVLFETNHLEHPLKDMPQVYLSVSNSLRQDLKLLAEFAGESKPPDLQDYVKEVYATGHHKDAAG